jgi:hypothetical protein
MCKTEELQGEFKRSRVIRQEGVRGDGIPVLSTALQSSITVLLHFGGEEVFSTSPVIILLHHPMSVLILGSSS